MFKTVDFVLNLALNGLFIMVFLSLKGKMSAEKKKLSWLSLLATLVITAIPAIGYRVDQETGSHVFGFPFDMIVYHGGSTLTTASLGLIVNFFFFYWLFKGLQKCWKAFLIRKAV
ncbi:hypothetical protein ACFFJY_02530 [Fictibacillus aquaticus]|uniref:Uncharacterized protein n=1 Tax=Fictibacillus aquaticus TaxID=2021314 RepID=A0A235F8E5_9BACL|nr:hypothetical protein [Fictibacillus aquaticus]OYD57580.1 hypothetical protein CGZ90_13000 [Fictibacillus aquaticus]